MFFYHLNKRCYSKNKSCQFYQQPPAETNRNYMGEMEFLSAVIEDPQLNALVKIPSSCKHPEHLLIRYSVGYATKGIFLILSIIFFQLFYVCTYICRLFQTVLITLSVII